jgi:hypothetical protein
VATFWRRRRDFDPQVEKLSFSLSGPAHGLALFARQRSACSNPSSSANLIIHNLLWVFKLVGKKKLNCFSFAGIRTGGALPSKKSEAVSRARKRKAKLFDLWVEIPPPPPKSSHPSRVVSFRWKTIDLRTRTAKWRVRWSEKTP